jgi:N utilization substance protein B
MGARRKARELALQMLFQQDMSGNQPDQIIATFEELQKSKPNTREFATKIFRGTVEHMPEIDEMIQNQAENWRLSRMARTTRPSW